MQTNYTLKQAVKTAIALLAISAQTNVFALGLGNIEVNSHLGEPLNASIKVQGASALKNLDNLQVISDSSVENQLSNANFKLSKIVDDVAILTVTTNQVLNEPIVNLSIEAKYDATIRRDYVLLLDPPLTKNVEDSTEISTNTDAVVETKKTNAAAMPVKKTPQTVNKIKANKKSTATAKTKQINKDIILTAGYTDVKPADIAGNLTTSTASTKEKINKPRLSISAGESSAMPSQHPQLRMDMQLQFTPENAPVPLQTALAGDIEIQDELVVMNNRMAYLKSQIDQLAQKNQVLKAENQHKTQLLASANASSSKFFAGNFMDNKLNWLGFILGGALLFSSASIINKWRLRRKQKLFEQTQFAPTIQGLNTLKATNEHDSFFDFDKDQAFNQAIEDTTQHIDFNDDIEELEAEIEPLIFASTAEKSHAFSVEEFNNEQNILDHADVFLTHGRTSLAIQLLHNHLIEHPKKSVTEWLFLLDLLAKENMQAMYEQTTLECKEHFNIRISDFSNDEDTAKNSLEDFPRLVAGLEQVWGSSAAQIFLDDLIYNSRLETRVGFEKPVIEELLLLKSIAHEIVNTAEVIQLDDKKLALKAQKEAKLAAIKEDRIKKVNELIEQKIAESNAQQQKENNEDMFEFSLAEYN
jgi:hypothetical protein